ncbi:hypothetical protein JXD20_00350 [Candidatus Peregrinibacteria bacterium]|nr:hypothetical protein [Candidatus Peregrinibacteria bacterium]
MKRITFYVHKMFEEHIDQTINAWGFQGRADFFRFAALDFILRNKNLINEPNKIEDYAKAVRSVQAAKRRSVTELESDD